MKLGLVIVIISCLSVILANGFYLSKEYTYMIICLLIFFIVAGWGLYIPENWGYRNIFKWNDYKWKK
jgi:uncharacterized membrane-anchored protein